jgi:hypothetical protein
VAATSLIIGVLPISVTLMGHKDHGSVPLRQLALPLLLVAAGIACINSTCFRSRRRLPVRWPTKSSACCAQPARCLLDLVFGRQRALPEAQSALQQRRMVGPVRRIQRPDRAADRRWRWPSSMPT